MKFRPCIDIHNGKVKQIVGGSLLDEGNRAKENFVSEQDGAFYAALYKERGLTGGHSILLNPKTSEYYEEDVRQACLAFLAFPKGIQIGGGINDENAAFFLEKGASHVIVTSFVFKEGKINYENLNKLVKAVGKERLVLDLSCRKKKNSGQTDDAYYIVTDRWQKFTDTKLEEKVLDDLSNYCSEFLIHAVDVEGKSSGIEEELVAMLGNWGKIPMTYAGGISSYDDIDKIKQLGKGNVDFTIGSALDLFGGALEFEKVCAYCQEK